jgi:hypothetical protein
MIVLVAANVSETHWLLGIEGHCVWADISTAIKHVMLMVVVEIQAVVKAIGISGHCLVTSSVVTISTKAFVPDQREEWI